MFEIRKRAKFEAAHQIEGHIDPDTGGPGKCSRCHGHSYEIAVCIRSPKVQKIGFVVDYYWIGKALKILVERWDHFFLNSFPEFASPHNSTAERIAQVVFEEVADYLNKRCLDDMLEAQAHVYYAECKETEETYARYYDPNFTPEAIDADLKRRIELLSVRLDTQALLLRGPVPHVSETSVIDDYNIPPRSSD